MPASRSSLVVVGIDVGGKKKGFHAVALKNGRYHERLKSDDVAELVAWCVKTVGASVVAVDAPCRWSITGKSRPAELEMHAQGIRCFFTPIRDVALKHPKDNFGWMFNGEALFNELEKVYPLRHTVPKAGAKYSFETYPHAITWHLRGGNAAAKEKRAQRGDLLKKHRVTTEELTNIDWVDAALCALTAQMAANGERLEAFGEPQTGFIIVPAKP